MVYLDRIPAMSLMLSIAIPTGAALCSQERDNNATPHRNSVRSFSATLEINQKLKNNRKNKGLRVFA